MSNPAALLLLHHPVLLAGSFIVLIWLLATWAGQRDAHAIQQAGPPDISREQGAAIVGLIALWIIFRRRRND